MIIDYFLPAVCVYCGTLIRSEGLCERCRAQVERIKEPLCTLCGIPFDSESALSHPCPGCLQSPPSFESHRSLFVYDGIVREMIHCLKFKAGLHLLDFFSMALVEKWREFFEKCDYLIPVPLFWKRLIERTFNQSAEVGRMISKKTGIPLLLHSLQKIRSTPPQTSLKRDERIKNLENCFEWKGKENLEAKIVCLIDDVYSTGSTLSACAESLKDSFSCRVVAVTLAFNKVNSC